VATLILPTKIGIPPLRENSAPRPRLLEQCATGLACKLLLVSAPAGFGKTTLLMAWVHHEREYGQTRFGWLALDRADSMPARFWTYFITRCKSPFRNWARRLWGCWKRASSRPSKTS